MPGGVWRPFMSAWAPCGHSCRPDPWTLPPRYGLSPFSSEALALLDSTGATYRSIELGPEWFLLNGRASAKRAELLERTWVGRVAPLLTAP